MVELPPRKIWKVDISRISPLFVFHGGHLTVIHFFDKTIVSRPNPIY